MGDRIKLLLAYEGTRYCGWQRQPADPSVQAVLEKAVHSLTGERVSVIASGRTDSGVHARGQVCHFDVEKATIPPEKYSLALNRLLPVDVRVMRSRIVDDQFHSRYSARTREYRYYLLRSRIADPFQRPFVYANSTIPDLPILETYAPMIVGTHDFTTFSAAGDPSETKIRNIDAAGFYPENGKIVFRIVGNAFLWRMVRSLIGTMIELGRRQAPAEEMRRILDRKDRSLAGPTAPSRGLFLHKVVYDAKYAF